MENAAMAAEDARGRRQLRAHGTVLVRCRTRSMESWGTQGCRCRAEWRQSRPLHHDPPQVDQSEHRSDIAATGVAGPQLLPGHGLSGNVDLSEGAIRELGSAVEAK